VPVGTNEHCPEVQPAALGVAAGQNWAMASQTSSESERPGRSAKIPASAEFDEKVVDLDGAGRDDGVKFGVHAPPLGILNWLWPCSRLVVGSESIA
jgi:hypothetical protein